MTATLIDLFAGCGGLSLGLSNAGFSPQFAVEAHDDAFQTYSSNLIEGTELEEVWPSWLEKRAWHAEQILDQYPDQLAGLRGKIDLIAGGPPCQGFSMNGLRRPDDPRSRMVEVYLDYVKTIRPRLVLLENVVGFRSMKHRTGGTYSEYVESELEALGYDTWSEIIRAADWGVPQRRPRFVLIAALKRSIPGVDPLQRLRVARKAFLRERGLSSDGTTTQDALSDLDETGYTPGLDSDWGHLGFKALQRATKPKSPFQLLMRAGSSNGPTDMRLPRHSATTTERMRQILKSCERGVCLRPDDRARLGIRKRSTTPLDPLGPAPTISTLPDDFIHYAQPRAMTVREHARLQSFPDWFSFKGPYTTGGSRRRDACPKYTQVGNAVPPLLAEALGETLMGLLSIQQRDEFRHPPESVNMSRESLTDRREIVDRNLIASV